MLELFSGRARLCRLATSLGMPSQAHDISYDTCGPRSSMDVNESAGFMQLCLMGFIFFMWVRRWYALPLACRCLYAPSLALLAVAHARYGGLLCLMGVCCSTWVTVNMGTSKRDYLCPMGGSGPSVAAANRMVARCLAPFQEEV